MGALLAALLPLAGPLVEGLVKSVEKLFGPKTGETKLAAVVGALSPVLEALAKSGKIPGLPDTLTTFLIHADSIAKPGAASQGCIILPFDARAQMAACVGKGGDGELVEVV